MRGMLIDNKHDIGDTVYLKTDAEQLPRIVTCLKIFPNDLIVYMLASGMNESGHHAFEITTEKLLEGVKAA